MFSFKFRTGVFATFLVFLFLTLGLGSYYYFFNSQQKSIIQSGPCSGSAIKTGPADGDYEHHVEYLDIFIVKLCFLGFEDVQDNIFPENSLRLKIGFYDNQGKLHSYPARIGGIDNNGRVITPELCVPAIDNNSAECKGVTLSELRTALTNNTILEAQIIYGDDAPWPASSQTKANVGAIVKLKEAIKTGVDFPKLPKENNFILQIWSLSKLE
jgi:hypothetical protein